MMRRKSVMRHKVVWFLSQYISNRVVKIMMYISRVNCLTQSADTTHKEYKVSTFV